MTLHIIFSVVFCYFLFFLVLWFILSGMCGRWMLAQHVIVDAHAVGLGTLNSADLCQHSRLGYDLPAFRKTSYPLKLNSIMNVTNWEYAYSGGCHFGYCNKMTYTTMNPHLHGAPWKPILMSIISITKFSKKGWILHYWELRQSLQSPK